MEEGYDFGTKELANRTNELFGQHADLLEGEHACEDCTSPFELIVFTEKGRAIRKAEGPQGMAIFPFNLR